MKVFFGMAVLLFISCSSCTRNDKKRLAAQILEDKTLDTVHAMSLDLLRKGFNAGDGYPQVWIRDMNTFIETSLKVYNQDSIRSALLVFLHLQQANGEIVDGYVLKGRNTWGDAHVYTSPVYDKYIGFKNTVETDQESSLIQAFAKYIRLTGDVSILKENIDGETALKRLELAVAFLMKYRYSEKYQLLTGATTQDWGDVQVEGGAVVDVDSLTHWSVDVYDNAMFVIAMNDMASFYSKRRPKEKYHKLKDHFSENVRKHLWDSGQEKFIPHLYEQESPFPDTFSESKIYYHGGTAVAIEAGLLSRREVARANKRMLKNVRKSGAPSIGLTLYPVYPEAVCPGSGVCKEFYYQNGGDWDWFGGRMVRQLIKYGFVQEAYDELKPMLQRAIKNKGFYEWYSRDNKPNGSAAFKGSAGVLAQAVEDLKAWARTVE